MAHQRHVVVPYRTHLTVWGCLLGLTGLLVLAGRAFHEALSVPALLTITPLKAALVFHFFMDLRHEKTYIKGMVFTTLATLTVFLGMLFLDVSYR